MKRFYKHVTTGPSDTGNHAVLLDGKPVRTPAKNILCTSNLSLASAAAAEWEAQGETVRPETMPLTQLLTTAIDRVGPQRDEIIRTMIAYLDADLLCYRSADPEPIASEQAKIRDPWLQWFEKRFGIALETTTSLVRLDQSKTAHESVRRLLDQMDVLRLTAVQSVTSATGSIVLALAVNDAAIDSETAWTATLCEELHYERIHGLEKHGLDPTEEKRRIALRHDLDAAQKFLSLL